MSSDVAAKGKNGSTTEATFHYKQQIERHLDDPERLLHCVNRLSKIPLSTKHLRITGVGKTVNGLRHCDGILGEKARELVQRWKLMVTQDEEIENEMQPESIAENHVDNNDMDMNIDMKSKYDNGKPEHHSKSSTSTKHRREEEHRKKDDESALNNGGEQSDSHSSKRKSKDEHREKDRHKKLKIEETHVDAEMTEKKKDHSRDRTKSSHHNHSEHKSKQDEKRDETSSSSSKKHSSSHHRHHSKSKISEAHNQVKTASCTVDSSPSKTPSSSDSTATSSSPNKQSSKRDAKRSTTTSTNLENSEPKRKKAQNNEGEDNNEEGIDSSMGANFADVLGMLDMPVKKSKKTSNASLKTSPNTQKSSNQMHSKSSNDNSSAKYTPKSNSLNSSRSLSSEPSTSRAAAVRQASPPRMLAPPTPPPLDHNSILSEIPMISNNYKPMPLNKTVMECVYGDFDPFLSQPKALAKKLSDAETLALSMSSKTMRTKVYSGVRSGQLFQVPSLFDLCIRILQKNINDIEYTGGVPYLVLRPILEKASPDQLLNFEYHNPYLLEDTDELWKIIAGRTFRSQKREEDETWRQMYLRCRDNEQRKLSAVTESIKHLKKIAVPVRKTQLAYVDAPVKPPRNVQRKQEQFGTKSKLIASPAVRVAALSALAPNAVPTGDLRLRAMARAPGRDPAQAASRPKKAAPLMMKVKQFMRGSKR